MMDVEQISSTTFATPLFWFSKYLSQLVTVKNAVQVEFEHRIKCSWATLTSYRQELTSTQYPLRDRLKLFDATETPVTPPRMLTKDMKKNLQATQRRMMWTKRQAGTSCAAAQAASASVSMSPPTPNPTTLTANKETTRLSTTTKTPTSTKKAATTQPEDELEPWVDYIEEHTKRTTSWIVRQSQICWRQARMIAKAPRKTVGPSSSPTGNLQYPPSKKGYL